MHFITNYKEKDTKDLKQIVTLNQHQRSLIQCIQEKSMKTVHNKPNEFTIVNKLFFLLQLLDFYHEYLFSEVCYCIKSHIGKRFQVTFHESNISANL